MSLLSFIQFGSCFPARHTTVALWLNIVKVFFFKSLIVEEKEPSVNDVADLQNASSVIITAAFTSAPLIEFPDFNTP